MNLCAHSGPIPTGPSIAMPKFVRYPIARHHYLHHTYGECCSTCACNAYMLCIQVVLRGGSCSGAENGAATCAIKKASKKYAQCTLYPAPCKYSVGSTAGTASVNADVRPNDDVISSRSELLHCSFRVRFACIYSNEREGRARRHLLSNGRVWRRSLRRCL